MAGGNVPRFSYAARVRRARMDTPVNPSTWLVHARHAGVLYTDNISHYMAAIDSGHCRIVNQSTKLVRRPSPVYDSFSRVRNTRALDEAAKTPPRNPRAESSRRLSRRDQLTILRYWAVSLFLTLQRRTLRRKTEISRSCEIADWNILLYTRAADIKWQSISKFPRYYRTIIMPIHILVHFQYLIKWLIYDLRHNKN